jgi:hypothetical protein
LNKTLLGGPSDHPVYLGIPVELNAGIQRGKRGFLCSLVEDYIGGHPDEKVDLGGT